MKKKNIYIGIGVLAGLLILSKIFKSMRKPSVEQVSKLNMDLVLAKGSEGAEVFELQRILKDELGYDLGYTGIDNNGIDGKFGNITENALTKAKQVKQITLKEMSNEK